MDGLSGVRVLEVAAGVPVAWSARLFADLGADVIRLESDDDVVRSRPFDVHRWLNANKRSVRASDPSTARDLPNSADIILHGFTEPEERAAGLAFPELSAENPLLVMCAITPWGGRGPYAEYRGEEISVMHGCSWGFLSPASATDHDLPPLRPPGHHATINTGTLAATVALAAFYRAQTSGQGERIDFSMFAAAAKMTEYATVRASFLGQDASRFGTRATAPWGTYACRDGLINVICPEDVQFEALVEMMGDPEWARSEIFVKSTDRWQNQDVMDHYLAEWFATQSLHDVYHAGQKAGICMTPVYSMSDLPHDDYFASRGFFSSTPGGTVLPGPPYRSDKDWWRLKSDAPSLGEHDNEGWLPSTAGDRPLPVQEALASRPLEGVRVCDFTWVWAGPFCTLHLAHLGADVIRIESPDRPDFTRRLPIYPEGVEQSLESSAVFQQWGTDKRSIAIDLRHPAARALVLEIVKHCDVVVDNFSAGTMTELGLGVDDLRSANPDVIIASMTGYGQSGPYSRYLAYGPTGGAMAGLLTANGYAPGDVLEPAIAVGDPCTGIVGAWAIVAALVARRKTGEASVIDVPMVEAVAATLGELWMEYATTGVNPAPRANHDAQWVPHNCYPAVGEDRWVTIACTNDAEWKALCSVVNPSLVEDARFAKAEERKAHEAELDELLTAWTSSRDRWGACEELQSVGVAAFPSLSPMDLWVDNPQLEELGMLERPEHPVTGAFVVPGIPWRLERGPNGVRRPAPLLGQHTDEVLTELLDYDPATVIQLHAEGVCPRSDRNP